MSEEQENGTSQQKQTQLVPIELPGLKGTTYIDQSMAPKIEKFIENAKERGVDLDFNSAYRTPEYQAGLKNDPMAITPASNSLHSAGFAVDVNFRSVPKADQKIILAAAEAAGLKWGGNFNTPDPPHFYSDLPLGVSRKDAIRNASEDYRELSAPQKLGLDVHPLAPAVERLGLAALDTPEKVGRVAESLELSALRDNVRIESVVASKDQAVVFGVQGDATMAGGYRHTHARVEDVLAMAPQAMAQERDAVAALAQEREARNQVQARGTLSLA